MGFLTTVLILFIKTLFIVIIFIEQIFLFYVAAQSDRLNQ